MKYDVILSIIFYLCGCFYMVFGAAIIATNTKNNINKLFLSLTSSLAIWSFSYSISTSAPSAEASAFWRSFSAFGWGIFSSFLLHFILVLTKKDRRFNKRRMLVVIYSPALINIILFGPFGFLVEKQYQMVQTDFGWTNMAPMYAGNIWLNVYYVMFSIASIMLLIGWWRTIEAHTPAKREAKHFILSIMFLFLIEAVIEFLPDLLGRKQHPKFAVPFLLIPTITLFSILRKTGLIEKRNKTYLSLEISKDLAGDRSRLFKMAAAIFLLGGAISFLIGYFGMNRTLEYELALAASMILMGIIMGFIPLITRKNTIQNIAILIICMLSMLYFMIKDVETGALTVWSIYILFLLFTVILDDRISAIIFTVFCVAIQIVFWISYPKVTVIIDKNEYATRIFVILISYFLVRYLTTEYASKVKEYRRFAREQETLEKISSSFITIDSGNVKEKVDEMFKMAFGVLDFNYAYLLDLSVDGEDAKIQNTYVKEAGSELFPYQPGMKMKKADLLLLQSIINQNTAFMCEDITNISFDEAGKQRDYFMSRGIHAFFAIPITINNRTGGILVIEYNDRLDPGLAQSRLNFLIIIANILGDAKKKILYEERLYNYAYFDEATKLANRNMLKKRLERAISNTKDSERVAVIDIELENLRMINDTFGHSVGEQIIIQTATILENLLDECCDISRASEGGFVVVLPHVRSREQIEAYAKKLLASFSRPISTETGIEALFVFVYIGISVYPDDGADADTLLKNADLAKYEAEHRYEKIVFITERLESYIAENTLLTNSLYKSWEREELFLEFQPQISCDTSRIVGVEALLRWTSDNNTRIPPDRFIPILEQTGLIYDVGIWVLEQALQEHNRLITKGFPPLRVSVNLSVIQFQRESFVHDVRSVIEKSGVNPRYIELEITESSLAKYPEDVIRKLYKLKELGVSIAIDDFGKGYSSLYRLKRVPFDKIKIDKGIIHHLDMEREKASITEIIILLARAFSATITAEGVETKEQADFLKSVACDEIQGYYFSKPLSEEALEEFLKKRILDVT